MIHIYCLINPNNNRPFYVGATKLKLPTRLSAHIHESKAILPYYWNRKHYLINYLILIGKKPRIRLLYTCATLIEVDYYEEFFYKMLISQGFRLLQDNSFSYSTKHQIGKIINQWSKINNTGRSIVKIN